MSTLRETTLAVILSAASLLAPATCAADTLDEVRARGSLRCGVNPGLPGFAEQRPGGAWRGLDVDLCRAVAAATLGEATKVTYVPLDATARFEALKAGQVDLLVRNSTWTMERDLDLGLRFAGVNYYDGQGFLVARARGLRSALELDGSKLCVAPGTTSEVHAKDYFTLHRMRYEVKHVDGASAGAAALEAGECDALTSDQSQLYGLRSRLSDPAAWTVLPEIISKEPLGPVIRKGDDRWLDIVRWSLFAMIDAEELGIDSRNVERARDGARSPSVRRFLGLEGSLGASLGLDSDWIARIIRQVGNYAESFERNVGRASPLGIQRGQNALWRDGGLLFAPPVR